ncbi:MAG: hypothetical protein ABSE89_10070 [Sedimentisphaerales bacterium]
MIAHNFNPLCKEAELYYYDFLTNEGQKLIPEPIINHINSCQYCCEQINQLKDILLQVEDYPDLEQEQINLAAITWLKLHFAYIGKPVSCETVKPFLPGFLEPALEIKIPTPITVHIDNCQQCQEDLEVIRKLNLGSKQLYRLSRLFADKGGEDNVSCSQAQTAVLTVASMIFEGTTEEVLKHLCVCSDCRKVLYQCRETIRSESLSNQSERKDFPCEGVSSSDIFDYAVPYGLDPAGDPYAKFRQSLTSHICSCPTCLAKTQQLHSTIFGIAERAESGIATIYHIDESAKTKIVKSDDIYAGFPIRVEVTRCEDEIKAEQPASTINITPKQKVSAMNIRPLFKIATAAAAVILIATALFLTIPAAKAITLESIYKAVEKVKSVYISKLVPGETGPTQEKWVSRTLNIYMTKTAKQYVLWDVASGVTKVKYLDTGAVETAQLTAEDIVGIEKKMGGSLGLTPFYDISDVPEDADWSRVSDKDLEAAVKGIGIYDLTWTERAYDGSTVFKKWRFFVNAKADLPQKIEIYQILPTDTEYILISLMMVEYLSDSEMLEVVKGASF